MKFLNDVGNDTGLTIEKRRNAKVRKKVKYDKLDIWEFNPECTLAGSKGRPLWVSRSHGRGIPWKAVLRGSMSVSRRSSALLVLTLPRRATRPFADNTGNKRRTKGNKGPLKKEAKDLAAKDTTKSEIIQLLLCFVFLTSSAPLCLRAGCLGRAYTGEAQLLTEDR